MGAGVTELLSQLGLWVTQGYMRSSWVMGHVGLFCIRSNLWATEIPIPLQEEINKCSSTLLHIPYFQPNPGPRSSQVPPSPHTLASPVQCSSSAGCVPTSPPTFPRVPLPHILPYAFSCYVLLSSSTQLYMRGRWGSGGAPGGLRGFWKDYGGPVRDWGDL